MMTGVSADKKKPPDSEFQDSLIWCSQKDAPPTSQHHPLSKLLASCSVGWGLHGGTGKSTGDLLRVLA